MYLLKKSIDPFKSNIMHENHNCKFTTLQVRSHGLNREIQEHKRITKDVHFDRITSPIT